MSILETTAIMGTNPVMYWIVAAAAIIGGIFILLHFIFLDRDKIVFLAIGCVLILTSMALASLTEKTSLFLEETGRYEYKAQITDSSVIEELHEKYDNVQLITDNIVTFESRSPDLNNSPSNSTTDHYCPNCGNGLNDTDKFCDSCGKELSSDNRSCTECGNEFTDNGVKFCPECGSPRTN